MKISTFDIGSLVKFQDAVKEGDGYSVIGYRYGIVLQLGKGEGVLVMWDGGDIKWYWLGWLKRVQ